MAHDPSATSAAAEPGFPRPFGNYELLDRIGAGGMGRVYRARVLPDGPEVALKMPLPELMARPDARKRLYREYQALERFRHPGFAPVLEFDEHEGTYFFTMAFIEGRSLEEARPADSASAARLAVAVAEAMQHAHEFGIIHRDLKPANVIVEPDGHPVVVDFGIALVANEKAPPETRLTVAGQSIGTGPYMSPEQVTGDLDAMGPHSDVYSLGVILYWMLTNRLPFDGPPSALVRQILAQPPVPPLRIAPGIDPRLSAAAMRALEKNPADRFESMAAFAEAIRPAAASEVAAPVRVAGGVRYEFVGFGATAPAEVRDRVYLDAGNGLRAGVLDHHHGVGSAHSATRLVTLHPGLVPAGVTAGGTATVVLHEDPDLDCVAASYLAAALLTSGSVPPGADELAAYLDRANSGEPMFSFRRPYTLYAAYMTLARRLMVEIADPAKRWEAATRGGHFLIDYVLSKASGRPLDAVNAFDSPVMTLTDRLEMTDDAQRYERKLAEPATRARVAELTLPTPWGARQAAKALIVRNVQDPGDPEACTFFKDWARTDDARCPEAKGFEVLCVWMSRPRPRCIVSVRHGADVCLKGLGAILDAAETAAREGTGRERVGPPRPGFDNSDPWYDGRAHRDTIVDSPRDGTALAPDRVENLLLEFGSGVVTPLAPVR
jgi:predicted Ser/Thr protein kinase